MYWFLIFLVIGFSSNVASAFTMAYSEKFGKARGASLTFILRNITGIPVWVAGFAMAIKESESSGLLYDASLLSRLSGWLLASAGVAVIIIALFTIRIKAAAPATGDTLVSRGIYSIIRHPIHSGTFLEFAGIFILWPSLQTGIASALGIIWILAQTKFEERDLIRRIPEYKDYMKKVPRFFPYLGRKSGLVN